MWAVNNLKESVPGGVCKGFADGCDGWLDLYPFIATLIELQKGQTVN